MRSLPFVTELRNGPVVSRRDEDRVVAETGLAAALGRELAFEHAFAFELAAVGRKRDERAHHARAAVLLAREPLEQRVALVAARRPARAVHAGAAVERARRD